MINKKSRWLLDILNLFNISHYINYIKQIIIQCWIPSESNNSLCSGNKFCLISLWIKISLFIKERSSWKQIEILWYSTIFLLYEGVRYRLYSFNHGDERLHSIWWWCPIDTDCTAVTMAVKGYTRSDDDVR